MRKLEALTLFFFTVILAGMALSALKETHPLTLIEFQRKWK